MNTISKLFTLLLITSFSFQTFSQSNITVKNVNLTVATTQKTLTQFFQPKKPLVQHVVVKPDVTSLLKEDAERDKKGFFYRNGVLSDVSLSPYYSDQWQVLENGDRVWQTRIYAEGAQALSVYFDKFVVYGDSYVQVFDIEGNPLSDRYDRNENETHQMQHIPECKSEEIIVQLYEPKGTLPSQITINQIGYVYRGIYNKRAAGESDGCQNNINCPVGSTWQDQKRGVARVLVRQGYSQGYCTGTLVNNQNNDCKPYFLTALHCALNPYSGAESSTSDYNQWKFNFAFEVASCTGNPLESIANNNNTITGCVKKASSNDGGGDSGSDFLLLQLGSTGSESQVITKLKSTAINAYWNGWDASGAAVTGGAGIHHPSGDVKKISLYTVALQTTGWGIGQTHWGVRWSDGVTEGGSSGSALYNNSKRIVGTLTGGSSYCTAQNQSDAYGKMSYHWDKNTSSGSQLLKTFLDPNGTGNRICDGSYDPCNGTGGTTPDPDPQPEPGEPCVASSQGCDEYIQQVILNSLNNSTSCTMYKKYTSPTTTLQRGQSYTIEVNPAIVGQTQYIIYIGDVVSAWIDFNGDGNFSSNERVFYQYIQDEYSAYVNTATFTVPNNAITGQVTMRVRIGYEYDDPCGSSPTEDGEIEDYVITLSNSLGIENEVLSNLKFYPNPATHILNFEGSDYNHGDYTLQIIDMTGKLVKEVSSNYLNNYKLNVEDLDGGVYQLFISNGKEIRKERFIKN